MTSFVVPGQLADEDIDWQYFPRLKRHTIFDGTVGINTVKLDTEC